MVPTSSLSATAKLTTVRVVCQNTLNMALSHSGLGSLKVRHSASGSDKLQRAKSLLSGVKQNVDTLKEKLNLLANRKIDRTITRQIMDKMFGQDWKESPRKLNQVERIAHLFDYNDNNQFPTIRGSAYNLLQAVTNYTDHERSVRETEGKQGMSTQAIRAEGALFGTGDRFKTQALDVILAETSQAPEMPALERIYQSVEMPQAAAQAIKAAGEFKQSEHRASLSRIYDQVSMAI